MYGCENSTIKKTEHQRIDAFELFLGEDSGKSLGLQGDPTIQFYRKSVLNIHWKDWYEAETPIFWPPDAKNWLIGKDPNAGQDWRWEEKGTEYEMVGWHHWLNGNESKSTLGVGDGQSHWIEWLALNISDYTLILKLSFLIYKMGKNCIFIEFLCG